MVNVTTFKTYVWLILTPTKQRYSEGPSIKTHIKLKIFQTTAVKIGFHFLGKYNICSQE